MMEAGDPRVSVVMITFNRRDEALRTLERLMRLPERPRVVVVDNGSDDGTATAIEARFSADRVEVIRAGSNLGAAGRTCGVCRVTTPYVAFCDDDSWWQPGDLSRAADVFDAHPRLGILVARILVGPENAEDPICGVFAASPLPRAQGQPGPSLLGFLACAAMFRRSVYLDAGGFDQQAYVGGEEAWLAGEVASRGDWICYVPEVTVHHHPSMVRDPNARRWREVRNTLWFLWLRRPLLSALRRTAWELRSLPRDGFVRQGFAAAMIGLPRLLPHRKPFPPHVERGLRLLERDPGRPPFDVDQ